jgi:PKD repeat protein
LVVGVPFTDEDVDDTHTATIDWGDGVSEAAVVDASTKQLSASHQFTAPGTYLVEICVSDDAGAETCDALTANVGQDPPVIFADGFESGDTSQWSLASGESP